MGYKGFVNSECEFYPCHSGVDGVNCLFCFCPLYHYDCGGTFNILENGWKDCSGCNKPHEEGGYDWVIETLKKVGKKKV